MATHRTLFRYEASPFGTEETWDASHLGKHTIYTVRDVWALVYNPLKRRLN